MILIKGHSVSFEMADGQWIKVPKTHGIIHDPDGHQLPKCVVYVGPYTTNKNRFGKGQERHLTKDAEQYFGPDYVGTGAWVDVPVGPWSPKGESVQIRYYRTGTKYRGKYFHMFETRTTTVIASCKRFYRIELPGGCIVNWRGFVYP